MPRWQKILKLQQSRKPSSEGSFQTRLGNWPLSSHLRTPHHEVQNRRHTPTIMHKKKLTVEHIAELPVPPYDVSGTSGSQQTIFEEGPAVAAVCSCPGTRIEYTRLLPLSYSLLPFTSIVFASLARRTSLPTCLERVCSGSLKEPLSLEQPQSLHVHTSSTQPARFPRVLYGETRTIPTTSSRQLQQARRRGRMKAVLQEQIIRSASSTLKMSTLDGSR